MESVGEGVVTVQIGDKVIPCYTPGGLLNIYFWQKLSRANFGFYNN